MATKYFEDSQIHITNDDLDDPDCGKVQLIVRRTTAEDMDDAGPEEYPVAIVQFEPKVDEDGVRTDLPVFTALSRDEAIALRDYLSEVIAETAPPYDFDEEE